MSQKETRVRIFNSEYNLQGEDPEKVERISDYVDGIMNRINTESPNQSEETIAVVSALNIAEDFFREKETRLETERDLSQLLEEISGKVRGLNELIDENQT